MEEASYVFAGVFWAFVVLSLVFSSSSRGRQQSKSMKPLLDSACVLMILGGLLMGTVVVESIISS